MTMQTGDQAARYGADDSSNTVEGVNVTADWFFVGRNYCKKVFVGLLSDAMQDNLTVYSYKGILSTHFSTKHYRNKECNVMDPLYV